MNNESFATVSSLFSLTLLRNLELARWFSQLPLRLSISKDNQYLIGFFLFILLLVVIFSIVERIAKPVRESRLWGRLIAPLEKWGSDFGTRKLLYPHLGRLEPGLAQPNIDSFVPSKLPTPLPVREAQIDTILSNYEDLYNRQFKSLYFPGLLFLFIALPLGILLFAMVLSALPDTVETVIGWAVLVAVVLCFPFMVIISYRVGTPQSTRIQAWQRHKERIRREESLFREANSVYSSHMQFLQEKLDTLRRDYFREALKTIRARNQAEEAERDLAVLRELSKQQQESVFSTVDAIVDQQRQRERAYWEAENQKIKDEAESKRRKDRKFNIWLQVITGLVFGLVFFILGLLVNC